MFATIIGPYPAIPDAASADDRLAGVLGDQLEAGLGLLTDGRLHRLDARPEQVVDAWRAADAVGHRLAAAAGLEPPLIKACLVGPWTLGRGDPAGVRAAVGRLGPAIDALFEAGVPFVQLTESEVGRVPASDIAAVDLLSESLERLAERVTGVGHLSLAVAGGRPTHVPVARLAVGFASYLFDLIASPDDWRLCARLPGEAGLIAGVVDPRPGRAGVREVGVWGARYAASLGGRGPTRTGICPGVGIERLERSGARAILGLAAGIARAADLPDSELLGEIDPVAVSARSAAMGRGELPPRRRRDEQ